MQQVTYQRDVLIDAPLAHVWQLVATEEGLRQWWGNTIFLEAKEGGRCEEWRNGPNGAAHWQGAVTLYSPPHQLMMTLRAQEPQADGPEITTISIALEANGEQTRVHVTQRAFSPTPAIGAEEQPLPDKQPAKPQGVPLAQLTRPAPGSLPMPSMTPMPATGAVKPTHNLLTRQLSDVLISTWQRRLASLVAISAT